MFDSDFHSEYYIIRSRESQMNSLGYDKVIFAVNAVSSEMKFLKLLPNLFFVIMEFL